MSDEDNSEVRHWLLQKGSDQLLAAIEQTNKRLVSLKNMPVVSFIRDEGLEDLCPTGMPETVKRYLGLGVIEDEHFSVRGDPGNVGHRLEIKQGNVEWDGVLDPWGHEDPPAGRVECGACDSNTDERWCHLRRGHACSCLYLTDEEWEEVR